MTVKILLVDDHPMIRHGLLTLLKNVADFQVVGEANDGLEALRELDLKKPDILVIDLMMPNLNGLDVLPKVKKLSPATRPIIFSMQSADIYVMEAFRAGAMGYVLKDTGPVEIVAAIQAVIKGDRYVSDRIAAILRSAVFTDTERPLQSQENLSPREREVLKLAAEGKSSAEIGKALMISPRTVETHRANLMKKLGMHNQAELIRYAIRREILAMNK
jgi:two-component system, NarL family, response regulator NreC